MDTLWHKSDTISGTSCVDTKVMDETMHCCRFLFDNSANPILAFDMSGFTVNEVNNAACELFHYGRHRFERMPLDELFADHAGVKKALKRNASLLTSLTSLNKEGQQIRLDISCTYLKNGPHKQVLVVCSNIVNDPISEKQKARQEALSIEVAKTESAFFLGQENERQRLARELHGHIGPMLVGVKLNLEKWLSAKEKNVSKDDIKYVLEKQTQTIKELRVVTSRLAEGFLYQEDINLAIRNLLKKFSEYSGISIYYKADSLPEKLPVKLRYHMFRILEESLTNAVMHANASRVAVRLWIADNMLNMYVLDNGRGMVRPLIEKDQGLWLMNQQANLLNGELQIVSVPDRFFQIKLKAPLKQ